jgi:exonuclease III
MEIQKKNIKNTLLVVMIIVSPFISMKVFAWSLSDIISMYKSILQKGEHGSGGKSFSDITPTNTLATEGEISVVTWNVTGKPTVLNGLSPPEMQQVSQIIQDWRFDIVGIQEIWTQSKQNQLTSKLSDNRFPGRSIMWSGGDDEWGDGLVTMARHPLDKDSYRRRVYTRCAGGPNHINSLLDVENIIDLADANSSGESPDCLSEKGFSMSAVTIHDNLVIHVYNTHLNTNKNHGGDNIENIKQSQLDELAAKINAWSPNNPVIVTGDFNMKLDTNDPDDQWMIDLMNDFAADANLTWACKDLETAAQDTRTNPELTCSQSGPDFIAYRSGTQFTLTATRSWRPDDGKVDNTHKAVAAVLEYELVVE